MACRQLQVRLQGALRTFCGNVSVQPGPPCTVGALEQRIDFVRQKKLSCEGCARGSFIQKSTLDLECADEPDEKSGGRLSSKQQQEQ